MVRGSNTSDLIMRRRSHNRDQHRSSIDRICPGGGVEMPKLYLCGAMLLQASREIGAVLVSALCGHRLASKPGTVSPIAKSLFLSRSPGHMLFLTPSEAVLVLITKDAPEVFSRPASVALEASGSTVQVKPSVVYMKLLDASPSPRIVGPG
jgi:hypothetical protein